MMLVFVVTLVVVLASLDKSWTLADPALLSSKMNVRVENDLEYAITAFENDIFYISGSVHGSLSGFTSYGEADCFYRKYDSNGDEVTTQQFGTDGDDFTEGFAVDIQGNVYIGGGTDGAFSGNAATGAERHTDAFLLKLNNNGNILIAKQFGIPDYGTVQQVVVDENIEALYAAGDGTLPGGSSMDGNTSSFLRQYDRYGNQVYAFQFGTPLGVSRLVLKPSSNDGSLYMVFVGGYPSVGSHSAYLRKYDDHGNLKYERQCGNFNEDSDGNKYGIATDINGYVYVGGTTFGSFPGYTNLGGEYPTDVFWRKYDDKGNLIMTRQFGTTDKDEFFDIAVDFDGSVYVAWSTGMDFCAALVSKYDANGEEVFTRQLDTPSNTFVSMKFTGSANALYVGGSFLSSDYYSYNSTIQKFELNLPEGSGPTPPPSKGRPAKKNKFRGDRGDKHPPAFASFYNLEETTDRSPDANVEYHCFEHDARYVRGTYGMRGYFEGQLDGHTAYVNFFEVTVDGGTLVPSTGSAAITYADDWSSVDGPFWSSGSTTMPGSWGTWGGLKACSDCFPSDMSMKMIRKEKCLWSDNEHSHFYRLPELGDRIIGTEQTVNNWFNIGYGPHDTHGQTVGAYQYTYTEKQCNDWNYNCQGMGSNEVGRYGSHTVSANVKGGRVLASDLQISSGPLKGHTGSGLYVVFNYADGTVGYTGYFCAAEWTNDSEQNGINMYKLVLVDCSYDAGDEMAVDPAMANQLLSLGYNNWSNFYSNEWMRLNQFYAIVSDEASSL